MAKKIFKVTYFWYFVFGATVLNIIIAIYMMRGFCSLFFGSHIIQLNFAHISLSFLFCIM